MCTETVSSRVHRNKVWTDGQVPRCVADIVFALNRGHCDVAGATCDSVTLADGRVLHVRRGFHAVNQQEK